MKNILENILLYFCIMGLALRLFLMIASVFFEIDIIIGYVCLCVSVMTSPLYAAHVISFCGIEPLRS